MILYEGHYSQIPMAITREKQSIKNSRVLNFLTTGKQIPVRQSQCRYHTSHTCRYIRLIPLVTFLPCKLLAEFCHVSTRRVVNFSLLLI